MTHKQRVGCAIAIVILTCLNIGKCIVDPSAFTGSMISGFVLSAFMLALFWVPKNNRFYTKGSALLKELAIRRKVFKDLMDDDNPMRVTRRKRLRAMAAKIETIAAFVLVIAPSVVWIWSETVNYYPTTCRIVFLCCFI